ncbi:hypothetical protein J4E05_22845 [Thalassospira sp. NFXS8]|uniref:hypothetical protein n=1 Tax=Thalassospira sp. NFXS8 TaxID=2819093 RepID=UPI0032DFC2B2
MSDFVRIFVSFYFSIFTKKRLVMARRMVDAGVSQNCLFLLFGGNFHDKSVFGRPLAAFTGCINGGNGHFAFNDSTG